MFWQTISDYFLHLDRHLELFTTTYDNWVYLLLFAIIFVETGLVIMPFLPGDSLLFAAGTLAGLGYLQVGWLLVLLVVAAILGDAANYWLGHYLSARTVESRPGWLNPAHLARTERFFLVHGGKAIILARFVPIVRTFAPFVAGIGHMPYRKFLQFNVIGAVSWVATMVLLGYFFGSIPVIQDHFHYAVLAIIGISLLPVLYEMAQARLAVRTGR